VAPLAERALIALAAEPSAEAAGTPVLADRERVLEVLTNLMDNAVKFSSPGDTVTAGTEPAGDFVRFWVRDQGPGIMPNERLRVFERFYTSDSARAAGQSTGTGLGLSIARQIVTRHGGEIWVADEPRGTTICFTIPVAPG
jgi:signal transduction histidine kinase